MRRVEHGLEGELQVDESGAPIGNGGEGGGGVAVEAVQRRGCWRQHRWLRRARERSAATAIAEQWRLLVTGICMAVGVAASPWAAAPAAPDVRQPVGRPRPSLRLFGSNPALGPALRPGRGATLARAPSVAILEPPAAPAPVRHRHVANREGHLQQAAAFASPVGCPAAVLPQCVEGGGCASTMLRRRNRNLRHEGGTCPSQPLLGLRQRDQPCCSNLCYDGLLCLAAPVARAAVRVSRACPPAEAAAPCNAGTAVRPPARTAWCAKVRRPGGHLLCRKYLQRWLLFKREGAWPSRAPARRNTRCHRFPT